MARSQKRQTAANALQRPGSSISRTRSSGKGTSTHRSIIERYRFSLVIGIIVMALVAGSVITVLKYGPTGSGKTQAAGDKPADPALAAAVTGIPQATFDAVGAGSASPGVIKIAGTPLTQGGKPEMLYIGAEYCPYCAAERWAMIAALSRFGSFTNLQTASSSASDAYPSTPTFSFYGSQYTSQYLTFTPVEQTTNQPKPGGGYTTLQNLTAEQQAILQKYDASPYVQNGGSIPFVDIGGMYVLSGATYSPGVLGGESWAQIAQALNTPTSPEAKGIVGSANLLTAAICGMTGQQPAAVCSSTGVTAAAKQLGPK